MGKGKVKRVRRKGMHNRWTVASINTGKGPNKEVLEEYNLRVRSLRTGEPVPPTLNLTMDMAEGPDGVPRAIVLKKLWQSLTKQGVTEFQHVVLAERPDRRVSLYFGGSQYFFIKEDLKDNTFSRSLSYNSKTRALSQFRDGKIKYIERMDVRYASTLPPSRQPHTGKPPSRNPV